MAMVSMQMTGGNIVGLTQIVSLGLGTLFLVEYSLVLTHLSELWQLVAFYSLNTLIIYMCFNKPSHAAIRMLGGNLLLVTTMNALHSTPQFEIVTPLLMLVNMLIILTVVRFYVRLFKDKPL